MCPTTDLVARLRRRDAIRDSAKTADPSAYLAAIDRDPPAVPHLALDATGPVAELIEAGWRT